MAEHSGIFNWLKAKVDYIRSRDYIAYWTADGSNVPLSALPNDNGLVTRSMLEIAIESVSPPSTQFRIPFTAVSNVAINWQTDMPDGVNTYASLFSNYVEAFVYFTTSPGGQPYTWTLDGDNNVLEVTFDWGVVQSGYILFN